jgi:hypothetical protein
MVEWVKVALLALTLFVLIEARIRLFTAIAVIERDLEWMRASLTKWGLTPPDPKGR